MLEDVSPITLVSEHNLTTHGQHRLPYCPQLLSLGSLEGTTQLFSKRSFKNISIDNISFLHFRAPNAIKTGIDPPSFYSDTLQQARNTFHIVPGYSSSFGHLH